jgi:hypothetical protein
MIALSLLLHPYVASSQSTNSFKIAVVVNDQIITNFEIDQRIVMLQIFGAKSISKKEIIDLLINERLFTHSAIELDVLPSKNEIDKSFNDFAKRGNLSKEDLLAYLSSRNVSKETLLSYISSGLTRRKVIQKKFVNNMIISNADIALEIANQKKLTEDNSNVIEYSELSASSTLSDIKSFRLLSTIGTVVDNCLDLQVEAKKYENINLKIYKKKKNNLKKDILNTLSDLDVDEIKIIRGTKDQNYLIMLCSRNSGIDDITLQTVRDKIFNNRINKIGNAYIQELKGEAFIDIK